MKPRETALRLKRFEADERARKVAELEQMIREFEAIASDLDRQIQAEEDRTGIKDPTHYAYSTFAKSASQRRDNLRASASELREKLEGAERDSLAAKEQLVRATAGEPREAADRARTRDKADRPGSVALR